ncbi:hypothetical protein GCM10009749_03620 [Agromyces neolithicus]|uniref:Uncharacterized protein n=1 Tax=Agromyces neolithicus TaxID=269420 RepID=A0ABP4Y5Z5_9MICO
MQQIVVVEEADPIGPSVTDAGIACRSHPRVFDGVQFDRHSVERGYGSVVDTVGDDDYLIEGARLPQCALDGLNDEFGALMCRDDERKGRPGGILHCVIGHASHGTGRRSTGS